MTSQNKNQLRIEGTVAPGFESVRQLYVHNMESLEERNTQLCVYHKGVRVVDLWASAIGDDTFSPDSLVNIFSSGKSLAILNLQVRNRPKKKLDLEALLVQVAG